MNVETITMPQGQAVEQLESYRRHLRRRADDEYTAVAAGYEALAAGTPLIRLTEAIRSGGYFDDGLPRLAVARADRRRVRVERGPRTIRYDSHLDSWRSDALYIDLDVRSWDWPWPHNRWMPVRGQSLVPMIPAPVRDRSGVWPSRDRKHVILWEVEEWEPVPPRDPLLLRPLGGDLYAVVAAWDLTALERAVMAGRAG